VTLLGVDEVRELGGISQEEDGRVVGDHVPIAFIGTELDGKSTRVTSAISRGALSANGRETHGERASLACLEDVGETEILN